MSAFFSQIPLNDAIYDQVRNFSQSAQVDALTDEEQRCLQKTLSYFKRHGAELDTDAKKRLTEIEVELTQHCLSFSQNVLDATNAFELYLEQESDLAGLPSSAIKAARQSAQSKEKPGYRFTLQAPSYLAVLKHLDDRKIREQITVPWPPAARPPRSTTAR